MEYDDQENPATTIFDTKSCTGDSVAFFSGPTSWEYNKDEMENYAMWDDVASSIYVPWNVVVTLFSEPGF